MRGVHRLEHLANLQTVHQKMVRQQRDHRSRHTYLLVELQKAGNHHYVKTQNGAAQDDQVDEDHSHLDVVDLL